MTDEPENPRAFPFSGSYPNSVEKELRGMTLRDYIAVEVSGELISIWSQHGDDVDFSAVASAAYTYADAMLAERMKGKP